MERCFTARTNIHTSLIAVVHDDEDPTTKNTRASGCSRSKGQI
jgi:hypothetical protein